MRAICFESVQQVQVIDLPEPEIVLPSDAIIRVELAGLCGSDLHPYFGREIGLDPGTAMGHEFVGVIVEIGDSVTSFQVGDRVFCPFTTNCGDCFYCRAGLTSRCEQGELFGWRSDGVGLHGGQSEYARVPLADGSLKKVPPGLDAVAALLLGDNLSTAFFGLEMALDPQRVDSDVFVVVGCGTVGLLAVLAAKYSGIGRVYAIDPNEKRLETAESLGAQTDKDPESLRRRVLDATEGRGADAVLEFVGLPSAQRQAWEFLRPGGRMSVIGCHCTPDFAFSPAQAYDKNLSYRTGRCPARHYMERFTDQLVETPIDLDWCITHRFGIEEGIEAYETFANRKDGCVKAVIDFPS